MPDFSGAVDRTPAGRGPSRVGVVVRTSAGQYSVVQEWKGSQQVVLLPLPRSFRRGEGLRHLLHRRRQPREARRSLLRVLLRLRVHSSVLCTYLQCELHNFSHSRG